MFGRVFVFRDMIALYQVLADAGMRRSEAAALVWDDIARWDNGSGRLTVRRSKTDATPRTVYLTPVAMAHLDAIRPEDAAGSELRSSACRLRRSRAASRPRPGGPATEGIPGGSGWLGAWHGPAHPRMRLWRRDAGAAQAWSPTTPGPKTRNVRRSGWDRSVREVWLPSSF